MEITKQEKINLAYIFISAYENIVNLIKPIHNSLCDLLKGINNDSSDLIISMFNIFRENFKNKKTIKIKDTHNLLVEVGIFSKANLNTLISLSKIRNDIGHESLNIYFNENISIDYFKLEDLLKLYKILYNKFLNLDIENNTFKQNKILNEYISNHTSLVLLINDLLINLKYQNLIK